MVVWRAKKAIVACCCSGGWFFFFAGIPQRPCTTRTYYVCSLASKCMYLSVCQPDVWLGTDIYSPFSAVVVDFIYFSAVATAAVDESNYDENWRRWNEQHTEHSEWLCTNIIAHLWGVKWKKKNKTFNVQSSSRTGTTAAAIAGVNEEKNGSTLLHWHWEWKTSSHVRCSFFLWIFSVLGWDCWQMEEKHSHTAMTRASATRHAANDSSRQRIAKKIHP